MAVRITLWLLALLSISAHATQTVWPPLTKDSFVGVWEAIFPDRSHLLHMEIRAQGDSYLTWVTIRYSPDEPARVSQCWRLVASDIRDGVVKLRFGRPCEGTSPPELWMIGSGTGIGDVGEIDAQFCGTSWPESPPPRIQSLRAVSDIKHILFIKGTWTRDYAAASQAGEKKVRELMSHE